MSASEKWGRKSELRSRRRPLRMSLLPFNAVLSPNFSVVARIGMKVVPHPPPSVNGRLSSVQGNFLRRFQSLPTYRDSSSPDKISGVVIRFNCKESQKARKVEISMSTRYFPGVEQNVGRVLTRQCSVAASTLHSRATVPCQQSPVAWDFLARLSHSASGGGFLEFEEKSFETAGKKRDTFHILYLPRNPIFSLPSTHQ